MNLDNVKGKKELISVLLLCVSAVMGVLILIKATSFFGTSAKAEQLIKRAAVQNNTHPQDMDRYFAGFRALADELKKNNLFVPPPPKHHPVKEVKGIFGEEVLIEDKWYKVGDIVAEAKIVSIGPTEVKIEWDGRERVFSPIRGSNSEGAGRPWPGRTTRKKKIIDEEATLVVVGPKGTSDGSIKAFGNLSEKERAKLHKKAEQKQRLLTDKEKFKKPSKQDSEKTQAKHKKSIEQKRKSKGIRKPKKEIAKGKIKKPVVK
jgi:hypothetical protein